MGYAFRLVALILLTSCASYIWSKQVFNYQLSNPEMLEEAQAVAERVKERIKQLEGIKLREYDDGSWSVYAPEGIDLRWHRSLKHSPDAKPFMIFVYEMHFTREGIVSKILNILDEEMNNASSELFSKSEYESHIPN